MKNKAVLMFLSSAMIMILLMAGCSQSASPLFPVASTQAPAARVYQFRMSTHTQGDNMDTWVKKVEEATGGQVKITLYEHSSLVAMKDTISALKAGIVDIAFVTCETFPSVYPLNNILVMPFMPLGDKRTACKIWHELQNEFPQLQAEWDGYQVLFDDCGEGNILHMTGFAAKTPADIKGLSLLSTGIIADIMKDQGASPLYLDVPDWFPALRKGLLDGMWLPWEPIQFLQMYSILPYHTTFHSAPGAIIMNVLMRNDAWDTIPADLQQKTLNLGPAQTGIRWDQQDDIRKTISQSVASSGGTIIDLTPEEVNAWYEAARPHHEAYLKKLDDQGLPATAIYQEALRLGKEYAK